MVHVRDKTSRIISENDKREAKIVHTSLRSLNSSMFNYDTLAVQLYIFPVSWEVLFHFKLSTLCFNVFMYKKLVGLMKMNS